MPVLVLVLSGVSLVVIVLLQQSASDGLRAELRLADVQTSLTALQTEPFNASPLTGGSPARAGAAMAVGRRRIASELAELERDSPVPALAAIAAPLRANLAILDQIYAIAASGADLGARVDRLVGTATRANDRVETALGQARGQYDDRASAAALRARIGTALTVAILGLAFAFLYRRSARARAEAERLGRENHRLAALSSIEARTDALTGLGNRRALFDDLEADAAGPEPDAPRVLVLLDLDGFKQYNDAFGHPAGDALLARLGDRLRLAVEGSGRAYRMGGDEFCVLARVEGDAEAFAGLAAAALSESGGAFRIRCSAGVALLPGEAGSPEEALQLADRRMYARKAGRASASRQSTDVLLKVLSERNLRLEEHPSRIAELATGIAERLALAPHDVWRIGMAAELHDIGNTAIPDAILAKPGPLDEDEWGFIRRHTLVGERIIMAAPALAPAAKLVRSSHERIDGTGYPDALRGDAIPLGARVIAVCDAFDAMVSWRPHRAALATDEALDQLRRGAGTQFDREVVEAFLALVAARAVPLPA